MIRASELKPIGSLLKPHGIKGEIGFFSDDDIDPSVLSCVVLDVDGIYVPFFVNGSRNGAADTLLVSVDGIGSEVEAKEFQNHRVFALRDDPNLALQTGGADDDGDGLYASDLVGYMMVSPEGCVIGEITGYNDDTANELFVVQTPQRQTKYIPMADEYMMSVDTQNKTLTVALPQGLLEI